MNRPRPAARRSAPTNDRAPDAPLVWVVSGYRAGERTQLLALAEALGWPCEVKEIVHRPWDFIPGLLRLESLGGIDRRASSPLQPPWPDLVISAGMRNEPVARWIRKRSGENCRLVSVGRPWAGFRHFDLVITTPQYRLPERSNVLHNTGTMHLISDVALAESAARWRGAFDHLPTPHIGVLVGGDSGPYTFGPRTATRLAREVSALAREAGGSLLISTSSRTSDPATDALAAALDCPHHLYRWTAAGEPNPYLAILSLCQSLVVTSDSVSMLSEAVGTGKPVQIFDLEPRGGRGDTTDRGDFRLGAFFYGLLLRYGHPRLTRDLELFHDRLIGSGHASWLGHEGGQADPQALGDLDRAVARVRRLMRHGNGREGMAA